MEQLCKLCGDELEVREYERLTPLKVASRSLGGSLSAVQSGDCVVAFSRKNIYEIKREIERLTPYRVRLSANLYYARFVCFGRNW